ncbi:unnamed protein product [Neospora caninum Liverpool]|nr:uncharacterized protein NCLIV_012920 [Neospora caninum Liverpool]CBZ51499.1 unnamed protein product [Neospora caninum Liverpool]|eukprot:XP_003881532.1 uncharacterized protein NCLIV_012920 [Neospora caninum Liverpool]
MVKSLHKFLSKNVVEAMSLEDFVAELGVDHRAIQPPFFRKGEGASRAVGYFAEQQKPEVSEETRKTLEAVEPVLPAGQPLSFHTTYDRKGSYFKRGSLFHRDFFEFFIDGQPFDLRILPLPSGEEGEATLERYKKELENERSVRLQFDVGSAQRVVEAFHCHIPFQVLQFTSDRKVVSLGLDLKMPNIVLIYPGTRGTLGQLFPLIHQAAQNQKTAPAALAARLSVTVQAIKLVAVTSGRGILVSNISPENFFPSRDGILYFGGFSSKVAANKLYYETEGGALVEEPPNVTSRGRRFTAEDNAADLGRTLFGLWCGGSLPEDEPSGRADVDFSNCGTDLPDPVKKLIMGVSGSHGRAPLSASQVLDTPNYQELRRLEKEVSQSVAVRSVVG